MAKDNLTRTRKKSETLRFTALDFFIIILVILCIVGVYFRDDIADMFIDNGISEKAEIEFKIEGVGNEISELMTSDNTLYYNGDKFGTLIEDCESTKMKIVLGVDNNNDRILDEVESADKYTVTGKLSVSGRYSDKRFFAGGKYFISVGNMLELQGPGYTVNVIITKIQAKQAD